MGQASTVSIVLLMIWKVVLWSWERVQGHYQSACLNRVAGHKKYIYRTRLCVAHINKKGTIILGIITILTLMQIAIRVGRSWMNSLWRRFDVSSQLEVATCFGSNAWRERGNDKANRKIGRTEDREQRINEYLIGRRCKNKTIKFYHL